MNQARGRARGGKPTGECPAYSSMGVYRRCGSSASPFLRWHPPTSPSRVSAFLSDHRVLSIDRRFVEDGTASFWAICVTVQDAHTRQPPAVRGKVDYREVLSKQQFAVFAQLRTLRK